MPAPTIFYDVAMRRLTEQSDRADKLDAKASAAFAFATGAMAVVGTLLLYQHDKLRSLSHPIIALSLAIAALVAYGGLVVCAYLVYQIGQWSFRPEMEPLASYAKDYDDDAMRAWVAFECVASIQENEPRVRDKARWVFWSLVWLAVLALMLTLTGVATSL